MKPNSKHSFSGIYCIRCKVNNKVYIGKAINIFKRIRQHIYGMNNKSKDENPYLINSWHKYGKDEFEYFVVEKLPLDETLIAKRELFWMKQFNSLKEGYNLRSDSNSKMIVHNETSKKISKRLKEEWNSGIRKDHGKKLSNNWKNNLERKSQQSKLFSKTLTKYYYLVDDKKVDYKYLKENDLKNCIATFYTKKSNKINFKGHVIERFIIEDIVRSSEKSEQN